MRYIFRHTPAIAAPGAMLFENMCACDEVNFSEKRGGRKKYLHGTPASAIISSLVADNATTQDGDAKPIRGRR